MAVATNFKKAASTVAKRKTLAVGPCKIVRPKKWYQAKGTQELPKWAEKIIKKELRGILTTVYVAWSVTTTGRGGGRAYANKYSRVEEAWVGPAITMRNNTKHCMERQMALLIHEVCHLRVGLSHNHDEVFTAEVIRMYRRYGILEWVHEKAWEYKSIHQAIGKALARSASAKKAKVEA